jgi:DNA-binding LytR/AlgR family response regulator
MTRMKCIIVDDEHLALVLLEEYIRKIPQLELVASCANSMEAMEAMQVHEVDLLFLDIQMPDLRGTDLVRTLIKRPLIIFTTAYAAYAVESYELQAVDYLLKPIEFERFLQATNKASEQLRLRLNTHNAFREKDSFLLVKADHATHKIFHQHILYIEGLQEYVVIHTTTGKKIITLMALTRLEEALPNDFLRIHRSYIVRIDKVNSLYGNQVVIGDVKIPIGKSYKAKALRNIFDT